MRFILMSRRFPPPIRRTAFGGLTPTHRQSWRRRRRLRCTRRTAVRHVQRQFRSGVQVAQVVGPPCLHPGTLRWMIFRGAVEIDAAVILNALTCQQT